MNKSVGVCIIGAIVVSSSWVSAVSAGSAAASHALLSLSSGASSRYRSPVFRAAGAWQLQWRADCTSVASPDFHVAIFKPSGQRAHARDVHVRSRVAVGTAHYRNGGSFYLLIHSPCRWQVTVIGTPAGIAPASTPTFVPTATPLPTSTPLPSVHVTPRACTSDPSGKGCADFGFNLAYINGVVVLTRSSDGQHHEFSQFGVARDTDPYGAGGYYFYIYVRDMHDPATDPTHDTVSSGPEGFTMVASSGHPYYFHGCRSPKLTFKDLFAGESNEGWMCTDDIDPQYIGLIYTLHLEGGYYGATYNLALADVTADITS